MLSQIKLYAQLKLTEHVILLLIIIESILLVGLMGNAEYYPPEN